MTAWHWPQWVLAGLLAFDVVIHISKDGEPRRAYNGPIGALSVGITAWLLWCGGFWG